MPTRLLHSSVLRWPDSARVRAAVEVWAEREIARRPGVVALGLFGSYARGDAGVGSDLDLIAIVESSGEPFEVRPLGWDLLNLPVPAEILVYTRAEWRRLRGTRSRFPQTVEAEAIWLHGGVDA